MPEAWEGWYCVGIMVLAFGMLLKNVAGPDVLMLGALAMMMAAGTVDLKSGLEGFSNKGLLTVACLFVVAAGISNTGALDYYMGKLLGTPRTIASAQIRLMVPIAVVSAFLNNTPVVAIMIPIVQKWARKCNIPNAQLFIPLSFSSILGGTCTLIGTSTNLVVEGMMRDRYPDATPMGLFTLSMYGVPVALSGMAYMLLASPFLLPGGKKSGESGGTSGGKIEDSLAVGAVVAPGSPVVNKPVATLRGLNGLYLVSVQRGDMLLRAVTPEFLLEEGDVLHFTGLIESIGDVCVEHGLLPLTHEVEEQLQQRGSGKGFEGSSKDAGHETDPETIRVSLDESKDTFSLSDDGGKKRTPGGPSSPYKRGARRRASMELSSHARAAVAHSRDYKDILHGFQMDGKENGSDEDERAYDADDGSKGEGRLPRSDKKAAHKRKGLNRGRRQSDNSTTMAGMMTDGGGRLSRNSTGGAIRRTHTHDGTSAGAGDAESGASGPGENLVSVHDLLAAKDTPLGVRNALLERHQVLKCKVRTQSALIGKTAAEVSFREKYSAALIAVQRGGEDQRVANDGKLGAVVFEAGDILILHCLDKCPLLQLKEPALSRTPTLQQIQQQERRNSIDGMARRSSSSSVDRHGSSGAALNILDEAGATVLNIDDPLPTNPTPSRPNSNPSAAALLNMQSKFNSGSSVAPSVKANGGNQRVSLDGISFKSRRGSSLGVGKSFTVKARATPNPSETPGLMQSAVTKVSSMLRIKSAAAGDDGSLDSLAAASDSRPQTPSAGSRGQTPSITPDPDLEVLSREGAEDLRAVTDFTCPMRVLPAGAMEGKTLSAAGLHGLPGLFLTAVQQSGEGGEEVAAPPPDYVLQGGDILWFAGDAAGVHGLRRIPGLAPQTKQVDKLNLHKTDRRLVQAVIAVRSPLIGQTVRDSHFRTCYDAVIIAVQRSGGRIQAKIGDICLQAGDVLLLDTGSSFLRLYKADPAFALVSEIENSAPPQFEKLLPACGTAVVMIVVFVAGFMDLFVAALLASGVMLATGCLTQDAARSSVKWEVITTIAAAFGISAAMEQSGVAGAIATTLVDGGKGLGTGTPGVLVAVYVATFFLCNVVGNNAAAALMYPIAANAAEQQVIDRDQMAFLLMLAASASFMSPFGYQTNLMVYGPGGYVFADFLRFGIPMQVVQMVVSVLVVLLGDLWWVGWVVGFGAIGSILVTRTVVGNMASKKAALGAPAAKGASTEEDESQGVSGGGGLSGVV